jgi:DNA-directed RNA polymerase sigma subunit (sigma70/sigma32)
MTVMDNRDPNDPVAVYILEASQVKPLTKAEEMKLFRELGHSVGEQRANIARRLVETQLMLVVRIAEKYRASGVPLLDLIQEGNIALVDGVNSFADRPVGDLSAHVADCIEDAILKVIGKARQQSIEGLG